VATAITRYLVKEYANGGATAYAETAELVVDWILETRRTQVARS
jgi:hypothetical protein